MGRLTYAHEAKATDVHGVTGAIVGTTDTQTLTNKTLTAPTITTPTITGARTTAKPTTYTTNGAVTIASGIAYISKAGVLALTVAAPSNQDGTRITFINIGSATNEHTITFTGGTLQDGVVGGGKTTATFTTGFIGQQITVIAKGVLWYLESKVAVDIT